MNRRIDVAIIGAGQAGLAMSQVLGAAGLEHVVFERGRIGERWRSERWPGLNLLTPNWMMRLPGGLPPVADPDGFMPTSDFTEILVNYARRWSLPVIDETEVIAVMPAGEGFAVSTSAGIWFARAVVVASGACDRPKIPVWASRLARDVNQIAPSQYSGPQELPDGGVLVVGASATGVQLAEDIRKSGKQVTLAVGSHVRTPRRYRGQDIYTWLDRSGFLADRPYGDRERLLRQPSFQLIGSADGRDMGLSCLADRGVEIVGRAVEGEGHRIRLKDDLLEQCAAAEARRRKVLRRVDEFITSIRIPVVEDPCAWTPPPTLSGGPVELDLKERGIRTIVWATGFRRAYPWLKIPVISPAGEICHVDGITSVPGLFVLGMPFMRRRSSALIDGVGRDAEALGEEVVRHIDLQISKTAA